MEHFLNNPQAIAATRAVFDVFLAINFAHYQRHDIIINGFG